MNTEKMLATYDSLGCCDIWGHKDGVKYCIQALSYRIARLKNKDAPIWEGNIAGSILFLGEKPDTKHFNTITITAENEYGIRFVQTFYNVELLGGGAWTAKRMEDWKVND